MFMDLGFFMLVLEDERKRKYIVGRLFLKERFYGAWNIMAPRPVIPFIVWPLPGFPSSIFPF